MTEHKKSIDSSYGQGYRVGLKPYFLRLYRNVFRTERTEPTGPIATRPPKTKKARLAELEVAFKEGRLEDN